MKLSSLFLGQQNVIRSYFQFLKNPKPHASDRNSTQQKIIAIVVLLVVTYGLILLVRLLNEVFVTLHFYKAVEHTTFRRLASLVAKEKWLASDWKTISFIILSAVGMGPFVEEVIFRLFLRYHPYYLVASVGLQLLFYLNLLNVPNDHPLLIAAVGLLTALGGTVILLLIRHPPYQVRLAQWWHQHFAFVYYYSAVAFGFVHYAVYGLPGSAVWFAPVILAPIILLGLLLGFIRVRYGIWYAILTHSSINAIGVVTALTTL